jgi:hypothetical protein
MKQKRTGVEQATRLMWIGVTFSAVVCLLDLYFRRWWSCGLQALTGTLTYYVVRYFIAVALLSRVLRDDGRVCATSVITNYVLLDVITACGENTRALRPKGADPVPVTCLVCVAERGKA